MNNYLHSLCIRGYTLLALAKSSVGSWSIWNTGESRCHAVFLCLQLLVGVRGILRDCWYPVPVDQPFTSASQSLVAFGGGLKTKLETIMDTINNLPFVKNHGTGENQTRSFWNTTPSGNYGDECNVGKSYAKQAIDFMDKESFTPLLSWIVLAIQEKPNHSGIEVGFMSVIAQYAVFGAQQAKGITHA